jgi:hypothetical protein
MFIEREYHSNISVRLVGLQIKNTTCRRSVGNNDDGVVKRSWSPDCFSVLACVNK